MPLADATLLLWNWCVSEVRLNQIWQQNRGRCYEKVISFSVMVHLIADALLQYRGSARRAFEKNIEQGQLDASVQAAYKKLGRLPLPVSQAFLAECTGALQEAFPQWAQWQLPPSMRHLHVVILDGKAIKRVAKRLKALRGIPGGLLGGRALVALDWTTGLAVAMHADPDGEANDVRFVADLLPQVRDHVAGPRLWLADSAFCDLEQPRRFTEEEGDHFLVRYHPKVKFHPDPQRAVREGRTAQGHAYEEQWGWLGSAKDQRRRYVRRLQLFLPGKSRDLILVTDLLDAKTYSSEDLFWLYSERWGIEECFQKVTEVFGLEGLIGGDPRGCIFQLAFCLLLHNMIHVIRGYVAQAQDREVDEISPEKLFDDVERELVAWNVAFRVEETLLLFDWDLGLTALQTRLAALLSSTWSDTWLKSPAQSRHEKTKAKRQRSHNSVYRILQAELTKKRKAKAKPPS